MAITGCKENGEPMFDNTTEYSEYLKEKEKLEFESRNEHQILLSVGELLFEMQLLTRRAAFANLYKEDKEELKSLNQKLQEELARISL